MFLDTALQTLIYATGKPGAPISPVELAKIQKAIKDNIRGCFDDGWYLKSSRRLS